MSALHDAARSAQRRELRRAAFEFAACVLEEATQAAAGALRGNATPAFWQSHGDRPYSDESQLPLPEEGDRLSGLYQEPGMTEEEWEAARDRR